MKRLRLAFLAFAVATTVATTATAQPAPPAQRLTLEQMEAMFQNMRSRTQLNVDGELTWGYYFTDPSAAKLKPLAEELAGMGYRVVGVTATSSGALHILQAEKVEAHTPQTLHARNQVFYGLASKHGVASYDGMDVGPGR